jgi:trans-2,3-dihydro-3-hydroxyanthranilate isomerase
MRRFSFHTVDVFTDRQFGGNPLAVFPNARGLTDAEMQSLASELNLSETTFVLPPNDPKHTARVRIFNRTSEMPFAGHPNVGTAFVLASKDDVGDVLTFEEVAGLVEIHVVRDQSGVPLGARIAAPQALTTGIAIPVDRIAQCIGVDTTGIVETRHPPLSVSVGVPFIIAEVTADALRKATPDIRAFRETLEAYPDLNGRLSLHIYERTDAGLRARMFAPVARTYEDPATGSANAALAALLLSLTNDERQEHDVVQGVEMGRPSRLHVTAHRAPDGIRATVAGSCVPVLRGEAALPGEE